MAEAARADGSLVKARKGMAQYKVVFNGRAAHAGNAPLNGRSAITEFAHWVHAINDLTCHDTGTTLSVGTVSGGSAANVIPAYAEAMIDVRFWDNKNYDDIHTRLSDFAITLFTKDVQVTVTRETFTPAMISQPGIEELMALTEECGRDENIAITWQEVGADLMPT